MANNTSIRRKAYGIMKSIEIMNDKERSINPSEAYGQNYNILRRLCEDGNPELLELLPPVVTFEKFNSIRTLHSFSEIHSFCSEIYHLLEDA
jgi:hypothetical protein